MNFINKHGITVKISGFKITKDKSYYENEIISFIDEFLSYKTKHIEITKNNIKLFNRDMKGGYASFIYHASFNSREEILSFITTLNASKGYYKRLDDE